MSSPSYAISSIRPYGSSAESAELFPESIQSALDRIEKIAANDHFGPSSETVEWAKKVLLRVLPRYYLKGAEIDAFQNEIHVNWEQGNKRVTVFLSAPNQVRIYCEHDTERGVEHDLRHPGNDPWEVSGVLRWLFM
jgi:hypothetical protein